MKLIIAALILAYAIFLNSIELSFQSGPSYSDLSNARSGSRSRSGSLSVTNHSEESVAHGHSDSSALEYSGYGRSASSSERTMPPYVGSSSSSERIHSISSSHSGSHPSETESSQLEFTRLRGSSLGSSGRAHSGHLRHSPLAGHQGHPEYSGHSGFHPGRRIQIPEYAESSNRHRAGPSKSGHSPVLLSPHQRLQNEELDLDSPHSSTGSND